MQAAAVAASSSAGNASLTQNVEAGEGHFCHAGSKYVWLPLDSGDQLSGSSWSGGLDVWYCTRRVGCGVGGRLSERAVIKWA